MYRALLLPLTVGTATIENGVTTRNTLLGLFLSGHKEGD
jgi:hypothetical protein